MIFPGGGAGIMAFFDLAVVDRHDGIDIVKLAQRGNGRKANIPLDLPAFDHSFMLCKRVVGFNDFDTGFGGEGLPENSLGVCCECSPD